MKNKRISIRDRDYDVDISVGSMGLTSILVKATESEDAEKITRVVHAFLILAIGFNQFVSIPINDFQEVSTAILKACTGVKVAATN